MSKTLSPYRLDDVGPSAAPSIDLKKINPDAKLSATICSHRVHGAWGHWNGKHTIACIKPLDDAEVQENLCFGCHKGMPYRWYGFLHVVDQRGGSGFWICISNRGEQFLESVIPEGSPYRGAQIFSYRNGGHKKASLFFNYVGHVPDTVTLPEPADLLHLLDRIWKRQTIG